MTVVASADVTRLANALRTSGKQSSATTQDVLVQSSSYILAEMETRVPVDSGNLRAALGVRVHSESVEIGPDPTRAPYAMYVEFGTRPHVIRPKAGTKALAFKIGGKMVYAKKVNHPGTKAQPYVRPAFQAWVESLGPMAAEANVKVIKDNA